MEQQVQIATDISMISIVHMTNQNKDIPFTDMDLIRHKNKGECKSVNISTQHGLSRRDGTLN